jgi:hypothetical protein
MEWLKSQWAKWKVHVSVVGGVLVVATAYGTCNVDPGEVSNNTTTTTITETIPVSVTAETVPTIPVTATTTEGTTDGATTTTATE